MEKLVVKAQNKRSWGIYLGGHLVEGGFFTRTKAEKAAIELEREQAEWERKEAAKNQVG